MSEVKTPLLRPHAAVQEASPVAATAGTSQPARTHISPADLKRRGYSIHHWIRIDKNGNSQVLEIDKMTVMRRCHLPPRDLRLLDPLFVYPSTILGREKAIVVNLEQIRCVITAEEVLLLNSVDGYVLQYVNELKRRLRNTENGGKGLEKSISIRSHMGDLDLVSDDAMTGLQQFRTIHQGQLPSTECLPFEFRALEVALEAACTFLDCQATDLEVEAYPVLDELTSKINTINLERLRRLKSKLVILTSRVEKMRDEIEQLMDDDGDMAEMYLTEKKERVGFHIHQDDSACVGDVNSVSAPFSPCGSPTEPRMLEKTFSNSFSHRKGRNSIHGSENSCENIEQLEMLLEAYFIVIDSTLNKLISLKQYIDDTEDFINIQLDNVRNQLIQFELLLTTATFVVAIYGVVAGVFGMNIEIDLFNDPKAFKWVIIIAGLSGCLIFFLFLLFFRWKGLMPLSRP
ncbi:hypothetical protein KP509_17G066000 [Ceratopteris richardii]|uniref:Magnesium transporter n=1 Tax=Ceratopteris richardii TaxID=49495 RepID=A0A8T2SV00_CERRI|nr:hypothetical protein KP509_17G066000 [Ceratopteris richardii]KAH7373632.1 hypothetical protein KP509_17G066000 [Ceratopteris richardii]